MHQFMTFWADIGWKGLNIFQKKACSVKEIIALQPLLCYGKNTLHFLPYEVKNVLPTKLLESFVQKGPCYPLTFDLLRSSIRHVHLSPCVDADEK